MKKRIRIILLGVLLVIIGALAWLVFAVQEPGGVDPQLLACLEVRTNSSGVERRLQELGTNVLPSLRFMIRQYDSPFKLKLNAIARKLHLAKPPKHTPRDWHLYAIGISRLVDVDVRSRLIPDWIYLVQHGNFQDRYEAFCAPMNGVGPTAVPALLKALDSRNPRVREFAVTTIKIPSQAAVIIPALLPKLKDPDEVVRAVTSLTLVALQADPETVVPLFTAALSDPSALVR